MPGYVATKLSRQRARRVLVPTPEEYVRSAMSTIGITDTTCGYWLHDILHPLCQWVPKRVWEIVADRVAEHRKEK